MKFYFTVHQRYIKRSPKFPKIFEQNSSMFKIGTGGCGVCGGCGGWYPSGFGGGCTGHGGCSGVFPVTFVLY